ncbi:MAG: hypothetical protein U0989_14295 [Azonexus sp.]|nr:hypothetical protein [Azonexus sp.]MDZ4315925.1 hypothetical protein [Azonexus sp.]
MRSDDSVLWVWAEALQLLRGVEQRQRQFFAVVSSRSLPCWEPPVDAYEHDGELQLLSALPGVMASQVEVVFDQDGLLIRGQRPMPRLLASCCHSSP